MTLQDYIRNEFRDGKIDFWFRAHCTPDGTVEIYIHPHGADGMTTPSLLVEGNTVRPRPQDSGPFVEEWCDGDHHQT